MKKPLLFVGLVVTSAALFAADVTDLKVKALDGFGGDVMKTVDKYYDRIVAVLASRKK